MIVRRISYFTFIVAITTMATVSVCSRAHANFACNSINDNELEIYLANIIGHSLEWQAPEIQQGIKTGKLKITTNAAENNTVNICLEVDKNYKGEVASLFHHTATAIKLNSVDQDFNVATTFAGIFSLDKRLSIFFKNRILLI